MSMTEFRLRSKVSAEALAQMKGRIVTDAEHDLRLTGAGPVRIRKPDGRLLAVYLPGALKQLMDEAYPVLTKIRGATNNRGDASGTVRAVAIADPITGKPVRTYSKPVQSSTLGSFEASGNYNYCRLTAFSAKQTEDWHELRPLFRGIAEHFAREVPDRFANQARQADLTPPEWVIPGTPFTTITVNNSYPTGMHTDSGDLDEGFSCLAVARRGEFTGGVFTFPEYRVAVDLADGDLVLMDAHDWHGNTALVCKCGRSLDRACPECGAERISVVAYYRTDMVKCGNAEQEQERAIARAEDRFDRRVATE